jgi:hypothetical protein
MVAADAWVVTAAAVAAMLFIAVAMVHTLAAFGSPVGHHLWGADREELPGLLRAASVVSVLGLTLACLVVWGRAGRTMADWDPGLLAGLCWALAASLLASALASRASRSRFERRVLGPAAVAAAVLVSLVAAAGG